MRAIILFCLLGCPQFSLFAQNPIPKVSWLADDPRLELSDEVSDVKVDKEGNVWIITFSEIVRYDSKDFYSVYAGNVSHSSFLKYKETPKGKKYVYDKKGAVFFISNDTLVAYHNNALITTNYRGHMIYDIWFDVNEQLYFTSSQRAFSILDSQIIMHDNRGPNGFSHLVLKIDGGYPVIMKNDDPVTSNWKKRLLIHKKNGLIEEVKLSKNKSYAYPIIRKKEPGIYYFFTGLGQLFLIDEQEEAIEIPFESSILEIFLDGKKNLWISVRDKGVYFIPRGDFALNEQYVLKESGVMIVSAEDHEGGIWGYHSEKGPFRVGQPEIRYMNQKNDKVFQNGVFEMAIDRDSLLISFFKKLIKWNMKNYGSRTIPLIQNSNEGNEDNTIYNLKYDRNKQLLWASQRGRILTYKNENWVIAFEEYNATGNGKLPMTWLKFGESINVKKRDYDVIGKSKLHYFTCNQEQICFSERFMENIRDIKRVNDSIFIWADNNLYLRQEDTTMMINKKYPKLERQINDWVYFQNHLWLATKTNGVFILRKDSLESVQFEMGNINNARIVEENSCSIWLFSESGSFNYRVDYDGESRDKYTMIAREALPQFSISTTKVVRNKCYLGTTKEGLSIIDFDQLRQKKRITPLLRVEELSIGNSQYKAKDLSKEISHEDNILRVRYIGISHDSKNVNYKYRLLGIQENWINTTGNTVQFANLAPGDYQFEVMTRKGQQVWSDTLQIAFTILPPFWQKWWFLLLAVLTILLFVYSIAAYRLKVIQREQNLLINQLTAEQKALRAKMNPHFVFNIISSLRYLIVKDKKGMALSFIKQFSKLMRTTLDQIDNDTITLENELNFLKEYIDLEEFRLEKRFSYEFIGIEELENENMVIPSLLIQPLVENAIHHGLKNKENKGKLELIFIKKESFLKVIIRDNGIGLEKNVPKEDSYKSQGLSIIKKRLKLYNKSRVKPLKIERISDEYTNQEWTTVTLLIKLKANEGVNSR